MKKVFVFSFCIVVTFLQCYSQKKIALKEVHVYKSVRMAGNIAVDEQGKQLTPSQFVIYQVYAESIPGVTWDTVWILGNAYTATPQETIASDGIVEVGTRKVNRSKIILKPRNGYSLIKLELNQLDNASSTIAGSDSPILINYTYKGQHLTKKVVEVTELYEFPAA